MARKTAWEFCVTVALATGVLMLTVRTAETVTVTYGVIPPPGDQE